MYQNVILSTISQNGYSYLMIYAKMDVGGGSVWEFDDPTRQKKNQESQENKGHSQTSLSIVHTL